MTPPTSPALPASRARPARIGPARLARHDLDDGDRTAPSITRIERAGAKIVVSDAIRLDSSLGWPERQRPADGDPASSFGTASGGLLARLSLEGTT